MLTSGSAPEPGHGFTALRLKALCCDGVDVAGSEDDVFGEFDGSVAQKLLLIKVKLYENTRNYLNYIKAFSWRETMSSRTALAPRSPHLPLFHLRSFYPPNSPTNLLLIIKLFSSLNNSNSLFSSFGQLYLIDNNTGVNGNHSCRSTNSRRRPQSSQA